MRTCGSCGRNLPERAKFCGACGAVAESAAPVGCPDCGAPLRDGWEFCGACGARIAATELLKPQTRRARISRALVASVAVIISLGLIAFAAVWLLGRDSDGSDLEFASPPKVDRALVAALDQRLAALPVPGGETDRDQVRSLLGPPDAFIVSWESVGDRPEPVRYETWFYYELLTAYEFADERLIANLPIDDEEAVLLLPLQYDPAKFERGLAWAAVSEMVPGETVASTEVPPEFEVGLTAYAAEQLLVVFDDEGLVYAETIPLRGGTP